MSVRIQVTNNTNLAIKKLNNASKATLEKIAVDVMQEINANTPVDTGYLKSQNNYKITSKLFKNILTFYNNCNYAIFVHEGMRARRFIKDSINKKMMRIVQIALSEYRSWFS